MKHFYQRHLLAGLCLGSALFLLLLCAEPTGAAAQDNNTAGAAARTGEPAADPFTYNVPVGSGGFLPSLTGSVPAGIRVVGILCIRGREPLAALQFPGHEDPFYVVENDLIAVKKNGEEPARGRKPDDRNAKDEIMYVQVGAISREQVELFPKTNPSNVQIIR